MSAGAAVERGSRDELLARGGAYARLVSAQMGGGASSAGLAAAEAERAAK